MSSVVVCVATAPYCSSVARISSSENAGPRYEPFCASLSGRHGARTVEPGMPDRKRRTQRTTGITGRGLDPDILERPFAQQPAVAHTVQRNAAGQHERLFTRLLVHVPRHAQHDLFGHLLHDCAQGPSPAA